MIKESKKNNTDIENVEKYLKDINIKHIIKQEGNFSPLIYMSLLPECFSPYVSKYYNFDFGKFLFIGKQKYGILFFDIEVYLQTSRVSFEHFLSSDSFQEIYDFNKSSKEIKKIYEDTNTFSLKEKTEVELVELIKKVYVIYWEIFSSSLFSEAVYEDLVKEIYKQVGGDDKEFPKFFLYSSLVSFESFALRLDKQILLYLEHKDIEKYLWIFADYYDAPTKSDFLLKIKKAVKDKGGKIIIKEQINRIENEIKDNKKKLLSYYQSLPQKQKRLIDYIQLSMQTRDIRKDPLQRATTLISYCAKALLAKQNISSELVSFAIYQDFFNGFYTNENYKNILIKRKNCVVLFDSEGPHYEFSDPDIAINEIYKVFGGHIGLTTEIKGNPASKGKVSGPVKIILSDKDFIKFESGDILVTSMTRPEFIPLMKMAKAVVTDEGGITCHAAIISRELGLPCIIGTKVGTRILKDGDLVEVDANNGIVKIIK